MKENKNCHYSFFEWMQLFITISIPVAIAVYTVLQNNRELSIATNNRAQDLDLSHNEQQDLIFHECLKTLGKLIENYGQKLNKTSSASFVARFATLSALNRLDLHRRNFLIRLLYESKLITYESQSDQPPISLQSANLTHLNIIENSDRRILSHLSLENVILTNANFHDINIYGGRFNKSILTNADFSWTSNSLSFENNEQQLTFEFSDLSYTLFNFATYEYADFTLAIMYKANLNYFYCENCLFSSTSMNEINLQYGIIKNSSFMFANLDYANFYQANFGYNVGFYEAVMTFINATYTNFIESDLSAARLCHSIFDYAVFVNTSFSKAFMKNVSMQYTNITDGNFTFTDLSQSKWKYARCEKCIFDQTNFTNADLANGKFIQCDFRNAIITNEQLKQTASVEGSILPNGHV